MLLGPSSIQNSSFLGSSSRVWSSRLRAVGVQEGFWGLYGGSGATSARGVGM